MSVPKIKNKILGHRKQAVIAYGKIKLLKLVLDETIITNEYIFLFKRISMKTSTKWDDTRPESENTRGGEFKFKTN